MYTYLVAAAAWLLLHTGLVISGNPCTTSRVAADADAADAVYVSIVPLISLR